MFSTQSSLIDALIVCLPIIPLIYCIIITIMMFYQLPPLCSFTRFTMSDCMILDDMHYHRNFAIFTSFCIFCSCLVIYRHRFIVINDNKNSIKYNQYQFILIIIHLLSTFSFIISLIFIKFEKLWDYHRIFSYIAFISLLIYETFHSILYLKQLFNPSICQLFICLYFISNNILSILSSIIFAISLDRLYLAEWISFFSIIWYFPIIGALIIFNKTNHSKFDDKNSDIDIIHDTQNIEMQSFLGVDEP